MLEKESRMELLIEQKGARKERTGLPNSSRDFRFHTCKQEEH